MRAASAATCAAVARIRAAAGRCAACAKAARNWSSARLRASSALRVAPLLGVSGLQLRREAPTVSAGSVRCSLHLGAHRRAEWSSVLLAAPPPAPPQRGQGQQAGSTKPKRHGGARVAQTGTHHNGEEGFHGRNSFRIKCTHTTKKTLDRRISANRNNDTANHRFRPRPPNRAGHREPRSPRRYGGAVDGLPGSNSSATPCRNTKTSTHRRRAPAKASLPLARGLTRDFWLRSSKPPCTRTCRI